MEQGDESGGEVVEVQTPIGALREGTAVQFRVALIDLTPKDLDADGGEDIVDQEEQEASPTFVYQWIGLRENLQESTILNGKIYGFL